MKQTAQNYYAGILTQAKEDDMEVSVSTRGNSIYKGKVMALEHGGVRIHWTNTEKGYYGKHAVCLVHLADVAGVSIDYGAKVPE